MPALASLFLAISLILAVLLGAQLRDWTWGPALLAIAVATVFAIPSAWRRKGSQDFPLIVLGLVVVAWFAWRAAVSPVAELGQADLLLLAGAVLSWIAMRGIQGNRFAEKILIWTVAALLAANVVTVFLQVRYPSFSPIFKSRAAAFPSGFYAHYNEAANFLIATSLWVGAASLFGSHHKIGRMILGVIAVGGLAAVYYTRSRGGTFGAAVGIGVFLVAALMVGKRSGRKWFAPALVALPVMALGIGAYLYFGWNASQEIRAAAGAGKSDILDNVSRLYIFGAAVSSTTLHPWLGGGSRSFSWESLRFFEGSAQGSSVAILPEQVHNELLQATTDYGLIGAGLLIGLILALVILAVVRLLFSEKTEILPNDDAWRVGGLAGLAGMFVQSSFSFVFHLFPGILLLGICLGMLARSRSTETQSPGPFTAKILLSAVAVLGLLMTLPLGWKGTQVTRILWPTYFSKKGPELAEAKIDALSSALRIWPQASLYKDRASLLNKASLEPNAVDPKRLASAALTDYQAARRLHPFNADYAINLANLQSRLGQDAEAEQAYQSAIGLQGGMEAAFKSHFHYANHLLAKGWRLYDKSAPSTTLPIFEEGAAQMEMAVKEMPWMTGELVWPRVHAQEALGSAREANGDLTGALKAYDLAATFMGGGGAHYLASMIHWKLGTQVWNERDSSLALAYFQEGRRRIGLSGEVPAGVTPEQRNALVQDLDKKIAVLLRNHVEPGVIPGGR